MLKLVQLWSLELGSIFFRPAPCRYVIFSHALYFGWMSRWGIIFLFCFLFFYFFVWVCTIPFHFSCRKKTVFRSWQWLIPNQRCPSPFRTSFVWSLTSTKWRRPWWSLRYCLLPSCYLSGIAWECWMLTSFLELWRCMMHCMPYMPTVTAVPNLFLKIIKISRAFQKYG